MTTHSVEISPRLQDWMAVGYKGVPLQSGWIVAAQP